MVPHILHVLLIALEVVLIFNLLIVVHELGHFLAARWRGLVVDEFGIWFGKPLWRRKFGGVWYSLGSIPAGGFVKLPQLAPMEAIEGDTESRETPLPSISPLDKIIVALAGPVFSFLLAVVMAVLVWGIGKPVDEFNETTVIGLVKPGGPADLAGLKPGDRILEVDGQPVHRFRGQMNSVTWRIVRSEGETIAFKIERDGQTLTLPCGWEREDSPGWQRKSLRKVQIGPRLHPAVGQVEAGSPADEAGLRVGDVFTQVRGKPVVDVLEVLTALSSSSGEPVPIQVQRGASPGETVALTLQPQAPKPGTSEPRLGIGWGRMTLIHPTPTEQIADAVLTIGNMVDALISPKSDVKAQHFSGPVGILKSYYNLFDGEDGWRLAIAFSVFFNVNLALFNLLPFPVLDGGHITLALLEAIRRKPVGGPVLDWIQTACALSVMAFLAYVTFFDVSDFFSGKKTPGNAPAAKSPPAPPTAPANAPAAPDGPPK
jgi:regulator of sigma E protease